MKRILLAVTLLTFMLPASRQVEAGVEVSVDFFYDNLGSDGSWVELEDYGYCWQPSIAISNSHWRPYADGYWAYTDVGWTWVSYEDFGWATYHYGRWARLRERGWFWVPGREWGPAWVSWRTGGDYVGWAPLPPHVGGEVVYDGRPITWNVDVEFDIGPAYYNFVDVRYIGEPVLRERIFEPSLNITYITQTVNVTNITYVNSTVYNHGPDYDRLSRYSTRPIRRMTLEHDANTDLGAGVKANKLTRVQGDRLIVSAPLTIHKAPSPIAPKTVKEKIAKPTFERGWGGVSDPKAQTDLRQKMKNENPKNVPPPSVKPHDNAERVVNPATVSPPQDKGANKGAKPQESPPDLNQPAPPNREAPPDREAKRPLPPEQAAPPKQDAPADIRPKRPLPPERVAPPKQDTPPDVRQQRPLPPERVAPPKQDTPPDVRQQRPLPPERVAPPRQEAPNDIRPKRPLPPERVAPPRQAAPPEVRPVRPPPPERIMPPKREAPPEVPRNQPPPERMAPPPGPAASGPVKEAPRSKRPPPDKKGGEETPPPGS